MARLPSAADLGQRPTPSGRGGISRLQLSTPSRGAEAQAEIQFGKVVEGLGDTLFKLGMEEKKKVDEARAEEAYSNYQNNLLELEYGEQQGFTKILGGDVIKNDLVESYRERRKLSAQTIRDGLEDDIQKTAFDKRVSIADRQFDARLYRHKAEQSNIYQDKVSEGVFATERASAALNWDQPGQIEMSLLRTDREIERQARLKGITDVDVVNNQKRIAGTMIHADVMTQMLMTGKDKAAAAYYNQVKDQLTPEAMVILGSKIDVASVEGESIRGTDAVWGALGPKDPNAPIQLEKMEAVLRDRFKDDPRMMKSAIQDLRSRVVAHKDEQSEMVASNKAKVFGKFTEGATMEEIRRMPEYLALDGKERAVVTDYITDNGWQAQQRARAQDSYRSGVKKTAAYSRFWELSNPRVLTTISEEQILAMEPVLGTDLMGDLIQAKRKLNSPENIKSATIDTELFNVIAANAGLNPYSKNLSERDKEDLGRLRNEVEASIDQAQRAGKIMGRTEKEELMNKIIDKKVLTDGWGTSTPSMPAAIVRPEQRSQIFVPIESIDVNWLKGAINYIRSTEPGTSQWKDEDIKRNMKGRLERAYAISITGGGSEEGRKALEGKDDGIRQ